MLSFVALVLCLSSAVQAGCNHDNCLRAFIRSSAVAESFCATYAPGPTPDPDALASSIIASISASGVTGTYQPVKPTCTTGLPIIASACAYEPSRISSACSCLSASAVPTSTTAPTSTLSSSTSVATPTESSNCKANSNWPGWSGIKYAFIFGDSYTTTQFNATGEQPTATNPLGNPTYPGYDSSNGPNWVDFLTVKYNESTLLTYDIAAGGATIDSAIVAPYLPTVSSVAEQIENIWFPNYASKPASAPWSSDDTLFAVFDGINDVGNTYGNGPDATAVLYPVIYAVYHGIVDELYYAGARNFAFLNVPPVDRAPWTTMNQDAASQAEEAAAILAWNDLLIGLAKDLKATRPDVNIFTVDAWKLFTQVLDDPATYPATAQYQNTTNYCDAYQNGTPEPNSFNSTCGIPVDQYFWLNSLHPTYPMHDVLAQGVANQLIVGPNIC